MEESGKQRAIFLSCCSATTDGFIRSLATPHKPNVISYQELVKRVTAHFNPRPSKIVARFKFNSHSQELGETIADYVSELRKLSEFCEFGQSLDDMLCDRPVCGLAEQRVQQRLLAERDLTFDRAMKIAQAMEIAVRETRDLQQAGAHRTPVHKLNQHPGSSKQNKGGVEGIMTLCSATSVMQCVIPVAKRATSSGHAEASQTLPVQWRI